VFSVPGDQVRWGVLGSARITETGLAPAIASDPRSTLIATSSRDAGAARRQADLLGAPHSHGSYDDLLADHDVDIVYNPLPNSMHREWTVKALEAGKHVLCEKPMALTADDVRAMADAARAADRLLIEGFMWRYHPRVARVQQIAADEIGPLRLVRVAYTYDLWANYAGDRAAAASDIRLDPALGGGALGDIGSYTISGLRAYAGGKPVSVTSRLLSETNGVDLRFSGEVLFDNGVLGQFYCAMDVPGGAVVDLTGDAGRLRMPNAFRTSADWGDVVLQRLDPLGGMSVETLPFEDQFELEVASIARVLLDGDAPLIPIEDSIGNAELMDAIRSSWRHGVVTL
jgi:predicted dehydrogenase